jgi:hypothetical protein
MADRFFDTSAFAKHYRAELGTAKVDAFLAETGSRHFISDLGVVELHSVLARLVRDGQITAADFNRAPNLTASSLHSKAQGSRSEPWVDGCALVWNLRR